MKRPRLLAVPLLLAALAALAGAGDPPHPSKGGKAEAPPAFDPLDPEKGLDDLFGKLVQKRLLRAEDRIAPMPRELPARKTDGTLPPEYLRGLAWRCIGPANMGGRVTALAVVESDPTTFFVATASGGLLKTVNNGITFDHLFDREATVSIGDVAAAPSDPRVVWVGTGENNPRNSASYGDGVYKSTDGGKTWKNVGLRKSFQVGKILIHPTDPDVVYVGALGRLYGPNDERGLFKTTDGGKTWARSLYVDDRTGVIDARLDPFDPETVLVGAWERKRDAFDGFFGDKPPVPDLFGPAVTHGPGGGLFKTTDGGKHWKKLSGPEAKAGLPTAKLGRIGLDYSRKTRGLVYAIIDTERVGTGPPPSQVFLGILGRNMEDRKGAKLTEVVEEGPGEKGGLKKDDVVTAADGKPVENYEALIDHLRTRQPGDKLKLTVTRDGKEIAVEVTLGRRPGVPPPAAVTPSLGVQLAPNELKVTEAIRGGAAAAAGIEAGDAIRSVGGKKVEGTRELLEAIRKHEVGDKVKVVVVRQGREVEVEAVLQAGAPRRGPANDRPYARGLGGQQANVQGQQGPDGFQTGGVFASKDGGETWARANSLNPRPMYFSQVRVDPTDDSVYVLGDSPLYRSTDGGKTFKDAPSREVHPDHHALWIDPKNGRHMVLGCDGGFYATYDRGARWDHLNHLALGQFYHVAADGRTPYRVYGGLQDNGSWGGPSHALRGPGPIDSDWAFIHGGDGFVCRVDPSDPDVVYAEMQNGGMVRRNLRTGERAFIRPRAKPGQSLRFNWNTPFIVSHHNPGVVYSAAQFVFRSVKRGEDARPFGPEVARTKEGSATALSESPRTPDVLWAGTDDGAVWVTRDGGATWTNVSDKLAAAGLPGPRWVASLEASQAKEGRCYACLDGHRSDDDRPYLFVTEDFGATWAPIAANLPAFGSTRVLREDAVNPDLLYVGTEFGVHASANRGASWTRLNGNLPTVAVHEIAQPTTAGEIVAATHGRSLWVLDVASLRQMTAAAMATPATLFAPAPATRWRAEPGWESPFSSGDRKFIGTNPPRGAAIDYLLTAPAKELTLTVQDATGQAARAFRSAGKDVGLHRVQWDLTRSGGTALVPSGTYRAVLTVDGREFVRPVAVENDPHADPKALLSVADGAPRDDEEEEGDDGEGERWARELDREEALAK